jgi:hypothetical protein
MHKPTKYNASDLVLAMSEVGGMDINTAFIEVRDHLNDDERAQAQADLFSDDDWEEYANWLVTRKK